MHKVLIIAYTFPPVGGGRVRRVLKFVKYLREFGWEPVVLTVKNPIVPTYDDELINEIRADIKIIRTNSLEPGNGLIISLKTSNKDFTKASYIFRFRRILYKICNKIKWWIFIPDTRVGWIPFAVVKGILIIKKEKIDAILVMGEPFSSFLAGAILKFWTKKPLILDFRDEWVEFNKYFFPQKGKIIRALEEKLERFVIRNSDKVVSVTEPIVNNFRKRYAEYKDRFVCITNGFDPDDFKDIQRKKSKKFSVTYAGSLYRLRSPKYFLKAIEELIDKNPDIINDIEITFIGTISSELKYLFDNPAIKKVVSFLGFLKYKDTLNYLANSDILLYIEDQTEIAYRFLPAKLFDYIGVRQPILALANNGTVKDVIQRLRCGIVIPSQDIKAISVALKGLYNKYRTDELKVDINLELKNKFDRRELTRQLSEVLNAVLTSN